ncbi:MAG: ClpXP protease specificity-enhancing factor [Sedimenticolaceae bacterium]|jgi:stringent starvation protein B
MTSNRPYLIRALYEWLVDNDQTPYLLVDAMHEDAQVPTQFVDDGRIVLNVSPSAVMDLELGNEFISFNARFGGKAQQVFVPPDAVLGIYSKENGEGMLFPSDGEVYEEVEFIDDDDDQPEPPDDPTPPRGKPALKIVK